MRRTILGVSLALTAALPAGGALAQGVELPFEGILTGADDLPIDGMVDLTVRLYGSETSSTAFFEETHHVLVIGGFVSVSIGSVTPLPTTLIRDALSLYLGVTIVGDAELAPRFKIGFVPYAIRALSSDTASTRATIPGPRRSRSWPTRSSRSPAVTR